MLGDGEKGGDKYGGNGAGAGYSVQGSHVVGVTIWEKEFGCDGGHGKSTRWIPSSDSKQDYGDNGAKYGKRRVGVPLVDEALETAGLWPIKEYILQRQATVAEQVDCWPIYEL